MSTDYSDRVIIAMAARIKHDLGMTEAASLTMAGVLVGVMLSVPKEIVTIADVVPQRVTDLGGEPTKDELRQMAQFKGYTGDECTTCHGLNVRMNGTCKLCTDCGSTTGCS